MSVPGWLTGIKSELGARLEAGTLPHALLLLGAAGLGKRALARWLTRRALCARPTPEGDGCGQCRSCGLFAAGTHPDYFHYTPEEGKQQIGVDQIRDLISRAALTRSESEFQVFLIEPAERLNANAANALLKTLEEPTPGTLLLLLAERRDALPATVISRCQVLEVRPPSREQALAWLAAAHPEAAAPAREQALAAAGSPGRAAELLAAGTAESVAGLTGDLVMVAEGRADVAGIAGAWVDEHLEHRLRRLTEVCCALAWRRLGVAQPELPAELERVTAGVDPAALFDAYRRANAGRRLASGNLRPELLIEDWLLAWQRAVAAAGK